MKKKLECGEPCPKPGETFGLNLGGQTRRCQLISLPGVEVEAGDVEKALEKLNKKLGSHGLTPQDGELEAFAKQYPAAKKPVGAAFQDGPVMFRCAQKGRLMSHYVDDELAKVSLWLVVCEP